MKARLQEEVRLVELAQSTRVRYTDMGVFSAVAGSRVRGFATALKTPMSVYLTLVLCAKSASLTSSCSLAFIVDEFPRLPILSKLM